MQKHRLIKKLSFSFFIVSASAIGSFAQADTVKIAFMDPLSGPFAPVGQNTFNSLSFIAERANAEKWAGEHRFEVTAFDNKGSPQETLTLLKSVIDKGYRYVAQGTGSGVGLALIDAINKHNERNPGKELVYLNYGSIDPDMTNSKCSFWHFRFDTNSDMKMEALTSFIAPDKAIKKVYIIGQNYAHGHQVTRAAKAYLARKRPDIQIVGDDLHPIASVKDFSPYIAKIKASGADSVITGNWGADLALLIKAGKDAGLDVNFYTYYAGTTGVPTAMGTSGIDKVKMISYWHPNNDSTLGKELVRSFKAKYKDDYYSVSTYSALASLSKGIRAAGSLDPVKVAAAMEGLKFDFLGGEGSIRKDDHQFQQTMYLSNWVKTNGKDIQFDQENTGLGWKTLKKIDAYVAAQPTSCQMKRP
ncbi:MAG: branched-chain amino acid ABC transporter substrate-binding protein [Burkholderiales bacterium]|nr:branched-chain amino acid ABC transporter substrate-binding protein [Burkholderiales bacterium]